MDDARRVAGHSLSQVLVDAQVLSHDAFRAAEGIAKAEAKHIVCAVVDRGFASGSAVAGALSAALETPVARLSDTVFDAEVVRMLPEHLAHQYLAATVDQDLSGVVRLAMVDPTDAEALEQLSLAVGRKLRLVVAELDEMRKALYQQFSLETRPVSLRGPFSDEETHRIRSSVPTPSSNAGGEAASDSVAHHRLDALKLEALLTCLLESGVIRQEDFESALRRCGG